MVTIPDCEGLFEPLLHILEDKMAPVDDRVDAYLRMTDRLREEEEVFVKELLFSLSRIITALKMDIQCDSSELCQASLQAVGHCLYQEQIASSISVQDGQELVQGLLRRIEASNDKGVCTRALWCLAKQNLDSTIISTKLDSIFISLELVLAKDLQSVTVDHEVLCVIERLLEQLPKCEMIKRVECWAKLALPFLVSSASKVRERCLSVLSAGLEHMMSAQDKVATILVPLLKKSLIEDFSQMCSDKKELFVLKAWCCIVPILGENLHKGGSLINNLLKLVEQGFRVPLAEVQVMAFSAWNILIDNFALSLDILCAPKRIKLIMMPFLNLAVKERNEAVEAARLSTWWHFVCLLGPRVLEMFDQVCTPLLQFIFGTSIDQVSSMKHREGFGDLKCPPTPTNVKLLTDFMAETPKSSVRRSLREMGTPRTPTVLNASFAKTAKQKLLGQGCEILLELLRDDHGVDTGNHHLSTVERLQIGIFIRPEELKKYASLMINATREGFKCLGKELAEPLGLKIWSLLVKRISDLLERGPSPDYGEVFLPLLAVMQDFVDSELLTPSLTVKMLEELSSLSAGILSHHMACLHSKDNPQGSPALLLVQLLFTPTLLTDIWNCERFHLTFEHLISCGMTTASGQLFYMKTVLNLLEKAASIVSNRDALWRLWSCVVDQLNEHILKTNDVNQGDALEHDFSTLYLALTFPVKYLLDGTLPQGTAKELSKTLAELYRSFARASALVSTAETNVCCEELCAKILSVEGDWKSKGVVFTDTLVSLTGVMIESLDFSPPGLFAMATSAAGKSPNTTPTKWNKRTQKPMGNFSSMVSLIGKLLSACKRVDTCEDSPQTLGILTAVLTNLMDKLSYLFSHLNGPIVIAAVLKALAPCLAPFVENSHTSTKSKKSTLDKRLFTARLIQKIEKLWTDLLTCVQSRHCGPYNSDLLVALSPLLEVTFGHPKRNFKNHTVMFWNVTFAHAQWLDYPETLRPVLQAAKDKMSLTLPGWQNMKVLVKETEQENESEDLTQHTDLVKPLPYGILASPQRRGKPLSFAGGSPQLLKGSFLHKAASTEKAVENLSPKKIVRSPKLGRPRNSPAATHVRRKLPLSKFDDDDQEYVMIAPSPKKKRLLTEHQKEVMRIRREVPALYNALDQSQDCTQFSQLTAASQAVVTPDPSPNSTPEEEKDFNLEPVKKEVVLLKEEKRPEDDLTVSTAEAVIDHKNNEAPNTCKEEEEEGDDNMSETMDKFGDDHKEVDEVMEVDWEENNDESSKGKETTTGENESRLEIAAIKTDVENDDASEEEECEVTSPDMIPSSQTPSFESPFQSLRRVTIPLKSVLPLSFDSLHVNKEKTEKKQVEESDDEDEEKCETVTTSDVSSRNELEETRKCQSPTKNDAASLTNKAKVSPVSGRTRRKLLQKSTPSRDEQEVEPAEQDVSKLSHEDTDVAEKSDDQTIPEKAAVPACSVAGRDVTSSPVPSAMKKFLRPLAAGGSPSRVALRGTSSPGVSPTTGILKRWPGTKQQAVDSPSPPGKVRRVSFALPVKDSSGSEEPQEKAADSNNAASLQKGTSSTLFTAVKQRRPASATNGQSSHDVTGCMYPELISCSLPVEQILPSIVSMSWSRGLGHLVRAQNIHTIGNLSALKEEQVKNLPIKSPKVQTLKKALKKFHQNQRGRTLKTLGTKALTEVLLRESNEDKNVSVSTAVVAKPPCEATVEPVSVENQIEATSCVTEASEPAANASVMAIIPNMECEEDDPGNTTVTAVESAVVLEECNASGVEADDLKNVGSEPEKSRTPQRSAHDFEAVKVAADMATPQREKFALPTKLFSPEEPAEKCMDVDVEEVEETTPLETARELEKHVENKEETNIESDSVCDLAPGVSEQLGSECPSVTDVGSDSATKEYDGGDEEKFCDCLRSLKSLASPDVLRGLSSEQIFEAHHNLSDIMSLVVQALRGRWQSPNAKRTPVNQSVELPGSK